MKKTPKNKEPEIFCGYTKICDVNELKENPLNPNKHPKYQLERLAEIIKSNGWRQPVTVSDLSGLIVKGHGRYNAAKLAGFSKIPVEMQHYESKEAETADLIADNYVAELSRGKTTTSKASSEKSARQTRTRSVLSVSPWTKSKTSSRSRKR